MLLLRNLFQFSFILEIKSTQSQIRNQKWQIKILLRLRQAFRLLVTDVKDSIKEVKKDFEELKRSLEFSQKDLRDTDIKVTNLERKVNK